MIGLVGHCSLSGGTCYRDLSVSYFLSGRQLLLSTFLASVLSSICHSAACQIPQNTNRESFRFLDYTIID